MNRRFGLFIIAMILLHAIPVVALSQVTPEPPSPPASINPIEMLDDVSEVVPGLDGQLSSTLNILVLLTILALAPSILLLCTCFTRIVIVLGLLRQALGTQGLPPTQVIIGLSLFITFVVMAPTLEVEESPELLKMEEEQQRVWRKLRRNHYAEVRQKGRGNFLTTPTSIRKGIGAGRKRDGASTSEDSEKDSSEIAEKEGVDEDSNKVPFQV